MRIIMFGTGPFAVPTFQSLLDSEHEIPALVTRPIADAGKRRKSAANPTRDVGENAGLEILDPPDINDESVVATLLAFEADLFVVCDYGQIMSAACLSAARLGGINLHGSLLPKFRGAAPVNWAVYNGDRITGVTVIHMSPRLDAGPCLAKAQLEIGNDETAEDLEPKLARLGTAPVLDAIDMLAAWNGESVIGEVQDRALATKAPRLNKSDGAIDWTRSAEQIRNQIRAFQPWPGTFTNWVSTFRGKRNVTRLIIHRATVVTRKDDEISTTVEPGRVALSNATELVIQTGHDRLSIDEIQPSGKKPMGIADFLRGRQPEVGDRFTS